MCIHIKNCHHSKAAKQAPQWVNHLERNATKGKISWQTNTGKDTQIQNTKTKYPHKNKKQKIHSIISDQGNAN